MAVTARSWVPEPMVPDLMATIRRYRFTTAQACVLHAVIAEAAEEVTHPDYEGMLRRLVDAIAAPERDPRGAEEDYVEAEARLAALTREARYYLAAPLVEPLDEDELAALNAAPYAERGAGPALYDRFLATIYALKRQRTVVNR